MPLYVEIEYKDGTKEERRYPAEIWKLNYNQVTKMIVTDKEITSVVLDAKYETADTDMDNNFYPRRINQSRFELKKEAESDRRDMLKENAEEAKSLEEYKKEKEKLDAENKKKSATNLKKLLEDYK